ncbi:uncharacterized protein [Centruroides vittatus]|uniref:uncharacterized protein n=1 Tax=Centruroides vittatus TaxID=120091 RepID=UPI00350E9E00
MACKVLFDYAVRSFSDPMCHDEGSCGDEDPTFIFLCNFCRLDKCYKAGMKFMDHYEDKKYFYRDIQIRLASEHRDLVKRRYDVRGLVMEIVDQSFDVHLVLKIGKCYWDPWKYEKNEITTLVCHILELTLKLIDHCESREQFNNLKLKLIMKNDIEMELNEVDRRKVETLIPLLDKIEVDSSMLFRTLRPEKQ